MRRGLILLSVVLTLAGVASASVQQGDTELDFLGGYMKQNGVNSGNDFDAFFLSGALGYFFTDNIQGQVAAIGAWTSQDNVDTDVYGIGVRGKYHFMPTNQWVPYVGGQLMWVTVNTDGGGLISFDGDGILWGPLLGLRYELNANNDFYAEYQYQIWDGDAGDALDDGHLLVFGIIHQFK